MDEKHSDRPGSAPEPSPEASTPIPYPSDPEKEIPDGGLIAWLQVAGGAFLFFNSWYVIFFFAGL